MLLLGISFLVFQVVCGVTGAGIAFDHTVCTVHTVLEYGAEVEG